MTKFLYEYIDDSDSRHFRSLTVELDRQDALLITVDGCCGGHTVALPESERSAFLAAVSQHAPPRNPFAPPPDADPPRVRLNPRLGPDPDPPPDHILHPSDPPPVGHRGQLKSCQIPDCGCDGTAHP